MSNLDILKQFVIHHTPDFRATVHNSNDYYVFCTQFIVKCNECKINNMCSYFKGNKYPTITNKEFEHFKKNYPEYFI